MTINEKIDEIISARKSKIKNIQKTIENLFSVKNSIERFEDFRDDLEDDNSFGNIKNIDVQKLKDDCEKINSELERLEKRFSRDSIHLTFVGRTGQGKSLVMQRISGLNGNVIPSSNGDECTGAKSIIINSDDNNVHAEITFFTENEIVDIVNDYLETIFEGKAEKIYSIDKIKKINIHNLSEKYLDIAEALDNSKIGYLEKYINHIDDFKEYIGRTITVNSEEDIEEYVAQYKNKDKTKKYYKFLGVKIANIHSNFPCEDSGKIELVDTIGLDSMALRVDDEMLKAVKDDSDAILYMFRPGALRGASVPKDYEIIGNITKLLTSTYTKEMLFLIVNKVKEGDGKNIHNISEVMSKIEYLKKKNAIAICQALEVDCNDKDDVDENLLKPVLKQMSDKLEVIDNILISNAQCMLDDLFKEYNVFVEEIESLSEKSIDQDLDEFFTEKIDKTFGYWTGELKKYCKELKDERDCENESLREDFEDKLGKIFTHIPKIGDIQTQLEMGDNKPVDVYNRFLDFIRINIINDFLGLDKTLSVSVKALKKKIVHILADNDKGKFCNIIPLCDDPDIWLENFLEEIKKEKNKFKDIYLAVETLKDFSLTTKNYFIHEVRNSLDSLDQFINRKSPQIYGDDEEEQAQDIREYFYDACEEVKRKIEENCFGYINFSNRALWATARDFYDRITFSIDYRNDYILEMKDKWERFYKKYISKIWREEYDAHENSVKIAENFNSLKESICSFRNEKNFQIN